MKTKYINRKTLLGYKSPNIDVRPYKRMKGSSYKTSRMPFWPIVLLILALVLALGYILSHKAKPVIHSPVWGQGKQVIRVVEAKELTEHEQIQNYIRQVFGKDSDKAFKLLSCENHALNPDAVNDNTTWGGVGQDIGIFQINNKWQGVSNVAFLKDWKINILMAHSIYTRDHNSFKLWACSKKVGLK